jgi:hypothetical protein
MVVVAVEGPGGLVGGPGGGWKPGWWLWLKVVAVVEGGGGLSLS